MIQQLSVSESHKSPSPSSFLDIDLDSIDTLDKASSFLLSLVASIQDGSALDNTAAHNALIFFRILKPHRNSLFTSEQLLFELVSTPDKSGQGFITQMIPLLTCHNPEIVMSALELVYSITNNLPITQRLKVTEAGFFTLLPTTFFEQMIHLTLPSELYLIRIVFWSLLLGTPVLTSRVCESTDLTASMIHQTLYDSLIVPLEGFFHFLCRNRYEIKDETDSYYIAWVIGLLPRIAPYHAQTTQAVQRSSMSLAFCSGLSFFTTNFLKECFLNELRDGIRSWSKAETDVRNRSKVILRRLNEEGLSDTLEQHIQTQGFDDNNDMDIFTAALSIHLLGGNIPYIDPDY
ncbi:hypothetical protein BLNAU_1071 [Blattamonas nauphoetae]|uniref:Uncharacterized protein n=1 Tax=Blattamonas nauphoetae TaxID=2049346 RepID=A0ABQ9YJQ2_9EUKA|nr:hypothetical protein BLNAU_1071 [Blattamonas nauphoetae]